VFGSAGKFGSYQLPVVITTCTHSASEVGNNKKIGCFVLIMSLQMMINAHYCILLQNLEMQSFCSLHFSSNKVKVAKSDLSSC
jgi:hypothetical protein